MDRPGNESVVGNGPKVSTLDGKAPESTGKFLIQELFDSGVQWSVVDFDEIECISACRFRKLLLHVSGLNQVNLFGAK